MNDKRSILDDIQLALSHAPLEIHANIVFTTCRANFSRVDGNLTRLENEDELIQSPDKRQEVIENIYSDLREIRKILWIAVEVSNSNNAAKNSISEG